MKALTPAVVSIAAAGLSLFAAASAQACDPVPPPVVDIDANSYYTDAHHSVVDETLRARNIAHTKPLEDFLRGIVWAGNRYQAAPAANADEAACALTRLTA